MNEQASNSATEAQESDQMRMDTYEELREQRALIDGHRHPCAMDW